MKPTLFQLRQFSQNESPVFIVGAPRSGTSIVYRTLQKHSSFKLQSSSDRQVDLTESNIFITPYDLSIPAKLNYMLKNQVIYDQFLKSTKFIRHYQSFISVQSIFNKLHHHERLKMIAWKMSLSDLLVSSFFYHAKQARGVKRILEKSPNSIHHLTEIKSTFPKAKLLFIHRHPLDVFTSYKRRLDVSQELGVEQSALGWLKITPANFCQYYERYINIALKEQNINSECFLMICYSDFVNQTEKTIERICQFLEEAYEAKCLMSDDETQTSKWKIDPYLFSEVQKVTKNWQDFIDASEANLIESRLQKVMAQLGYNRYTVSQ